MSFLSCFLVFFFFKQKTAYEMRISDWSSDVCSSDLLRRVEDRGGGLRRLDAVDLRAFLDRRVGDDDALQPRGVALIGGGRILGGGGKRYGRRNEADAAEREERSRSAVRLTIGLDHEHPFWSQNQSCRMLMRSEEHTSELQSLMRISYAVFCLKKKK